MADAASPSQAVAADHGSSNDLPQHICPTATPNHLPPSSATSGHILPSGSPVVGRLPVTQTCFKFVSHRVQHGSGVGVADASIQSSDSESGSPTLTIDPRSYSERAGMDAEIKHLRAANAHFVTANRNLENVNLKLETALKRAAVELRARAHREGSLITKILKLESAIAVLRHQRDTARNMGVQESERANAVFHLFYKEKCPVDALVVAVLYTPPSEPDIGEDIQDLCLVDFSVFEDHAVDRGLVGSSLNRA